MRNIIFLMAFLPMPVISVALPWTGLMIWTWFALQQPHRMIWLQFDWLRFNQMIAIATIIGLLVGASRWRFRIDLPIVFFLFLISMIILSNMFSLSPLISWGKFQDFVNVIIYGIIINMFLINRFRIEMLIIAVVFSIGLFAAQGALLFVLSAGGHKFDGPPGSAIGDRNHLALAIVMIIPLLNYLREVFTAGLMKLVCLAGMVAAVLAVIGTGSRGGAVAMAAAVLAMVMTSRQKLAGIVVAGLLGGTVLVMAPAEWWTRIDTIETAAEEDNSFKLRLLSWQAHLIAGLERPLTGAGVYALNDREIFSRFAPHETITDIQNDKGRAAHSIYFQILGELGLVAFVGYMLMAAMTLWQCFAIIRACRGRPSLAWASSLARMIQASLVGFFVGGAAVSMAFYDVYIILIVLAFALRRCVREALEAPMVQRVATA